MTITSAHTHALQALLQFGQVVNAGIATVTHDPLVTLLIAAFVAALSSYVQNLGNNLEPPPPAQR